MEFNLYKAQINYQTVSAIKSVDSGELLHWRAFQVVLCERIHLRMQEVRETQDRSLGWKDPLEKETATHSSILAWRIPWMEEPGGLQSIRSQRVKYDWATELNWTEWENWASLMAQMVQNLPAMQKTGFHPCVRKIPWRRNSYPLQYSCLENSMNGGSWWAVVHRVIKNWTWLSD